MSGTVKIQPECLKMFKAECEERREELGLHRRDILKFESTYQSFLCRKSSSVSTLKSVSDALDMELIICLGDKYE